MTRSDDMSLSSPMSNIGMGIEGRNVLGAVYSR